MLCMDAQPNAAHLKLAQLEKAGKLSAVVTQNIDGLHQKAGSKNVFELHGTTLKNYCTRCGKFYSADYIKIHREFLAVKTAAELLNLMLFYMKKALILIR